MKSNYLAVLVVLLVLNLGLVSADITITGTSHVPEPLRVSDPGVTVCAVVESDQTVSNVRLDYQVYSPSGIPGTHGTSLMYLQDGEYCADLSTYTLHPVDGSRVTCTITATNTRPETVISDEYIFEYSVNDAPVIIPIPDQEAVEGVGFGMEIEVTDDGDPANLAISAGNSTLHWLSVDEENPLRLVGIPETSGIDEMTVQVTDGEAENGLSAPANFNVTVLPALGINRDSIRIETDEGIFRAGEEITLSPGEEVEVYFEFTNRFDATLGYVGTKANVSASGFTEFPYENACRGLDCLSGGWALESGHTGNDEFTFQVPEDIDVDTFILTLEVQDDGWFLVPLGTAFDDNFPIEFNVERGMTDFSMEATLSPSEVACEETVNLELTFTNTGENDLLPQVLVYPEDQARAGHSFNPTDATFRDRDNEIVPELVRETFPPLSSGYRQTHIIEINVSESAVGQHSLFIYAVDPHFPGYIGATDDVALTVNPCIPRTLVISNVNINGQSLAEDGTTNSTIRPGDTIPVRMTLTNYMSTPITGIRAVLNVGEGEEMSLASLPGIAAGASTPVNVNLDVPLDAPAGGHHLAIIVEGHDFEHPEEVIHGDAFNFILNIRQEPADLFISNLTLDHRELTCESSATLTVELTNRGSVTEDDIIVTVEGGEVDFTSAPLRIGRNDDNHDEPLLVPISAGDLSRSANTLTVRLSYRDNFLHDQETIAITRNTCLRSFTPTDATPTVADGVDQPFSLTLQEEGFDESITWTVADEDNVLLGEPVTGRTYTFRQTEPGRYRVTAAIAADEEPVVWTVTVTDVPITNQFRIPELSGADNLAAYENFWIEKAGVGRIEFTAPVDLTDVFDLDEVVVISGSSIAVDAPGLRGVPATITLFGETFTNPVIRISNGFNQGPFSECTQCQGSNANGNFVITVPGFSTFQVVEAVAARLAVSSIAFANVERGDNLTATVTITNEGTFESLSNVQLSLVNVNSRYSAGLNPASLGNLAAGAHATTTLTLTVPDDENSGSHSIGSLRAAGTNEDGQAVTATQAITLAPKSYLTIEKVDDGDGIKLNEATKITVKVQNDYREDMENVQVAVTIMDVDGDDLEEESADFDLKPGDDDEAVLEFDLTGEEVEKSEYTLEIVVEGEADDGTEHRTVQTATISVDREKHQVIIEKTSLSAATLQCDRLTTLQVMLKNVGESDEDEVKVTIRNDKLGLEESQDNIELEDFASQDNDYKASFSLELAEAEMGTYPITVEVYRDGSLEASGEVSLEVKECLTAGETIRTQSGLAAKNLAAQLQQELEAGLASRQPVQEVRASFRDSSTYALLLGILVLLLLIAVLLAIAVAFKKK